MRQRHTIPNYVNAYLSHPNETFKKKKESKDELQERVKEEKSRKKNEPR